MRSAPPIVRALLGVAAGVLASVLTVMVAAAFTSRPAPPRLVPEDASGHLHRIAIHYVPAMDGLVMPVWRDLFGALPDDVEVVVAVSKAPDFDHLLERLRADGVPHLERFRRVAVDRPLTTWSRDRMASVEGAVIAPPRVSATSAARMGDWEAPVAISRAVYGAEPRVADLVFEGGDLAASHRFLFADANLIGRNLGRGDAARAHLEASLRRTFGQELVWLGDAPGDVPEHHIMMYMVPIDDRTVVVGDARLGRRLAGAAFEGLGPDPDFELHAARFDRAAAQLAARGFTVVRAPVVVLDGAGSYVTYTNALFDRPSATLRVAARPGEAGAFDRSTSGPVVYLPTYDVPALDRAATELYESLGLRVVPIDVSTVYRLNGSLGCLVNVMARE